MRRLIVLSLLIILTLSEVQAETAAEPVSLPLKNELSRQNLAIEGYKPNPEHLNAFYEARNYRPAWDTSANGDRKALMAFLESMRSFADYHGLRTERYPFGLLYRLASDDKEENELKLEIMVTDCLLRLARDVHGDGVNLALLYPGWEFKKEKKDIVAGLLKATEENNVQDFVSSLAPKSPGYIRLAWELKTYRKFAETSWPKVSSGPTLSPGDQSPRIEQIRERLKIEGYLPEESMTDIAKETYDEKLKDAVMRYQSRNGLKIDGEIGAKTVSAMNVSPRSRAEQISANMERLRQIPERFPSRYAIVNIPDYSVDVFENGKSIYQGPVIVGKVDRKTPFIESEIRSVIFNPAWNVPSKIAREDILPKLRKDPYYLEKMGFVINGSADDPFGTTVNWNEIKKSEFKFRLRQAPGDLNSLGKLKFDFDNDFAVYMHGTPHQELFGKADRALSSGCVRLRDPELFATIVLAGNETDWTQELVRETIDNKKTKWLKAAEPLPIYFMYWTVFADEDGELAFREDIYGYDRFLIEWMQKRDFEKNGEQPADAEGTIVNEQTPDI